MNEKKWKTGGILCVGALWLVLMISCWFLPKADFSDAERRKLEVFPRISSETLLSGQFMSRFETWTQDHFPMRDRFRQMKAVFSYYVLHKGDNNGIYLAEGSAAKLEYPLKESSVKSAKEKFRKIYDLYLKEHSGKIVFSVVPDKGYYLAEKNGYPAMDYEALFASMAELEWAEYVSITDTLDITSYYTTDTHWRQEKLLPTAKKLAEVLDVEIAEDYRVTALERPFYGVYYGQAALPMEPETIYLMENEVLSACTVYNHETKRVSPVYDLEKLSGRDLYDVFLSGAVSVLEVENPGSENDRELIVFRDSFGSSIVPLLISGYSRVTLLDTRYVPSDYLSQFVDFHGQDVLFLYSPLVLNNSTMLK